MAPKDPSPHFGEIMQPPNRTIPQPKPGEDGDESLPGNPTSDEKVDEAEISKRPSLPSNPERMAADVKDEKAAPLADGGRGVDDSVKGLKKQKG